LPWRDGIGYRFFAARLRDVLGELREAFRDGTFAPFSRASLSPIAIACLRLVTFRPEPLLSVPFFLRRIVDSTFLDADFPYFAIWCSPLNVTERTRAAPLASARFARSERQTFEPTQHRRLDNYYF
jgi:hypothetical protein